MYDRPRFEVLSVAAPNVTTVRISSAATVENRHADTFSSDLRQQVGEQSRYESLQALPDSIANILASRLSGEAIEDKAATLSSFVY